MKYLKEVVKMFHILVNHGQDLLHLQDRVVCPVNQVQVKVCLGLVHCAVVVLVHSEVINVHYCSSNVSKVIPEILHLLPNLLVVTRMTDGSIKNIKITKGMIT